MFLPGAWDRHLANSLLLSHPRVWEHPVSFVDEGMDSSTHMIQNHGLDVDVTQFQPTQSHLHLPQIDWGSSQELPRSYNNQATTPVSIIVYLHSAWKTPESFRIDYPLMLAFQAGFSVRPSTEVSQEGRSTPTERAPELDITSDAPFSALFCPIRPPPTSRALPSQPRLPHDTPVSEERRYDRPGKKPAAPFQPDPLTLEEFCRRAGGSTFALNWIISTFKYGVTTEALFRVLKRTGIDEMHFSGGFEPHQAYDGFISKVGGRYEYGLCKEGNKTRWKNKKDAPRHLRKFHFSLADVCVDW